MKTMREYLIDQSRETLEAFSRGETLPLDSLQTKPGDHRYYPFAAGALSSLLRMAIDELEKCRDQ